MSKFQFSLEFPLSIDEKHLLLIDFSLCNLFLTDAMMLLVFVMHQ